MSIGDSVKPAAEVRSAVLSGRVNALADTLARRGELWTPGTWRLVVGLAVGLMATFTLSRAAMVWKNLEPGAATREEILQAFVTGLRFDLATTCYLIAPLALLMFLPWTTPGRSAKHRRVYLWGLTAMFGGVVMLGLAELEFFHEFQSRFNQLAIRYLTHAETVGGMIWYNYPVVRYVLIGATATLGLHLLLRAAMAWAYRPRKRNDVVEVAALVLIIAGLVIGGRGGLQNEPLRWGDAYKGRSEFANQLSLNGIYCLFNAAREMVFRGRLTSAWTGRMPEAEARDVARQMVVSATERLGDAQQRTVLRSGKISSSVVLGSGGKTPAGKPVNVVVVMMESFSARYSGSCGAAVSFTPRFDALAKDGVLFDRALSNGSHTHQGIFATQLGFPNLPGYETLMESSAADQHFLSIAEILRDRGYQTMFLYNGDFNWDNMYGFFRKQGIDKFVGRVEMEAEAEYVDPVWGVSDLDMLRRANREMEEASKRGPFFAAILTLSNHAPFKMPPIPAEWAPTGREPDMGELNARMGGVRYADYAIGQFMEEAKKLSYYDNTLFVFVGDHGFHVAPVLTEVHLLYHHVPLLFYAPGLMDKRGVDHRLASQVNILPSVLGLLGVEDADHASWGRSLFDDSFQDENFAVFKMSGGGRAVALARGDHMLVLGSSAGKPMLMRFSLSTAPGIEPVQDPILQARMERDLRAYVQAALHDLTLRRAGPVRDADTQ